MTTETRRRLHLGLTIQGPFSRNRRRRRILWTNALPYLVSAAATLWVLLLIIGLFTA